MVRVPAHRLYYGGYPSLLEEEEEEEEASFVWNGAVGPWEEEAFSV